MTRTSVVPNPGEGPKPEKVECHYCHRGINTSLDGERATVVPHPDEAGVKVYAHRDCAAPAPRKGGER